MSKKVIQYTELSDKNDIEIWEHDIFLDNLGITYQ